MASSINPSTQTSTLTFWKSFDLPKFQKELDQIALDIANRQDESDISRQKLVEQSREFKKNSSEDVKKCAAPLFKNFQQEIDSLSKRSKAAEAAFLSVYKQIIEIADPSTLIDQYEKYQKSAQRVKDLEIENKQLREALVENNKELVQVKYYEELCKKLEIKLKETEKNIQSITDASVTQMQEEMSKTYADKEARLLREKDQLEETVVRLKNEISGLRTSYESINVQLFDLKNKYDEDLAAKSSENDMLANDIDKLTHRAEEAERENRELKNAGINSTATNSSVMSALSVQNQELRETLSRLESDLDTKDNEINRLITDVSEYKKKMDVVETTSNAKVEELQNRLREREDFLSNLKNEVSSMSDYDVIKRELNVLKYMEFKTDQPESLTPFGAVDTMTGADKTDGDNKPLEVLVMEKNQVLKAENSNLKINNAQLNSRLDQLVVEYDESKKKMAEQGALIEKLERDISAIETMGVGYGGGSHINQQGQAMQTSSDVLKSATTQLGWPRYPSMESITSNTADSLLPIVSSQRERFKIRSRELEGENVELRNKVHSIVMELDQYKNDNLMLYEKIRFLQSYSKGSTSKSSAIMGEERRDLRERSPSATRRNVEKTYSERYETKLDPFRDFHMKEKMRKLANLNPPEKMIHFIATRMVSNRTTRLFAFIYMIFMHSLIFLVLYQLAKIESCHRSESVNWEDKYSDHMKHFHKD